MKKYGKWTLGGIQQKIFNLALYIILLIVAVFSAVIIYQYGHLESLVQETNDLQKQSIQEISHNTMDQVIQGTMSQSTQLESALADEALSSLESAVRMLADYAGKLLAEPSAFAPRAVSAPSAQDEGKVTTQLLTEEGVDPAAPGVAERVGLLANMSDMMESLYTVSRINSCYVATTDGVMLLSDSHPANKFSDDGTLKTFPMRQRAWYTGAAETGGLFFTDVEKDVFSGNIGIMCGMPVYQNGTLAGVVGADLYLNTLQDAVAASEKNGSFVFIVNQAGHVIFSPKQEGIFGVRLSGQAEDLRAAGDPELAQLVSDALAGVTDVRLVQAGGNSYYMSGAPVPTVGWALISAVDKAATDQPTLLMEAAYENILDGALTRTRADLQSGRLTLIVLGIVVLILATTAALFVASRIVKPLNRMTESVQSLGGENLQFRMEKIYETKDEIQLLAETFSMLSAKTLEYVDRVKTVTAEKERIGAELSMATAIQSSQLPRLFPPFPQRREFDLFASMKPAKEVGGDFYDFFLVDEDHVALVMADVSGKGVPAALFMMVSRVLIKARLQNGDSPAKALAYVNDQLCDSNDAGFFVTVWAAVLEISTGKGVAVNAGHEHPALRRAGESYDLVVYKHSPAVALMPGMRYQEHEFQLEPGDSVFVYTDGVAEATNANNELFGTERMLEALNRDPAAEPGVVLRNMMNAINEFVGDATQFDDITMLSLTYRGKQQH